MNRKQRRLARRIQRQARREPHTQEVWLQIDEVCDSPAKLDRLQSMIDDARLNPYTGPTNFSGMDWKTVISNLWDWFAAHWPWILKLIIAIAPLLLKEEYED